MAVLCGSDHVVRLAEQRSGVGYDLFNQRMGAHNPVSNQMKRTPLRRVSKARAKQLRAYSIMRPIFLRSAPFCEVIDCLNRSTEIHHLRGRAGNLITDERYLLAICRDHHRFIHDNPKKARAMGLLQF